jgi:hypothetical protein
MLYDPKWEGQTKPDILSLDTLTAWIERQPADQAYNYSCNGHCLLAQYFAAHGLRDVHVTSTHFSHDGGTFELPEILNDVAVGVPGVSMKCTFGAALGRARYLAGGSK